MQQTLAAIAGKSGIGDIRAGRSGTKLWFRQIFML